MLFMCIYYVTTAWTIYCWPIFFSPLLHARLVSRNFHLEANASNDPISLYEMALIYLFALWKWLPCLLCVRDFIENRNPFHSHDKLLRNDWKRICSIYVWTLSEKCLAWGIVCIRFVSISIPCVEFCSNRLIRLHFADILNISEESFLNQLSAIFIRKYDIFQSKQNASLLQSVMFKRIPIAHCISEDLFNNKVESLSYTSTFLLLYRSCKHTPKSSKNQRKCDKSLVYITKWFSESLFFCCMLSSFSYAVIFIANTLPVHSKDFDTLLRVEVMQEFCLNFCCLFFVFFGLFQFSEEKCTQLFVFVFSVIGLVYSSIGMSLTYNFRLLHRFLTRWFVFRVLNFSSGVVIPSGCNISKKDSFHIRLLHIYCLAPNSGSPADVWMCRLFGPLLVIALTENVESIKLWMKEISNETSDTYRVDRVICWCQALLRHVKQEKLRWKRSNKFHSIFFYRFSLSPDLISSPFRYFHSPNAKWTWAPSRSTHTHTLDEKCNFFLPLLHFCFRRNKIKVWFV